MVVGVILTIYSGNRANSIPVCPTSFSVVGPGDSHVRQWTEADFFSGNGLVPISSHQLNQIWRIVNWVLLDKVQRNIKQNIQTFQEENSFSFDLHRVSTLHKRNHRYSLVSKQSAVSPLKNVLIAFFIGRCQKAIWYDVVMTGVDFPNYQSHDHTFYDASFRLPNASVQHAQWT